MNRFPCSGITNNLNNNFVGFSNIARFSGLFSVVNSLESFPFSGSKIARAAGSSAYVIGKEEKNVIVKLSSG